ncbi:MAG: class I SAM-dependent methyltransferase [Deltaproteobacteria bacterium]|nr:class I SAM-dependent methyltransferase [Deltaproteobacteria bacterium]
MDLRVLIQNGIRHFGEEEKDSVVEKLFLYVNELFRWQKHINLTGFRERSLVIKELIFEALYCLRYLREKRRVMDAGSGSGATSIVFSLFLSSEIFSIERNVKKVSFQKHIKRLIGIPNLHIIHGSIEQLDTLSVDAIFAKAVGKIDKIVKIVDRHLIDFGILLFPKAGKERPVSLTGYVLESENEYTLPMSKRQNRLFIYRKIGRGR